MKYPETIKKIRDQHLNRIMIAVSVVGFMALLASLSKVFHVGWHPVMMLHIAVYVFVAAAAVFRNQLSFMLRAIVVLSMPFVAAVGGLVAWGLLGFGIPTLFVFCILATLIYGRWAGVAAVAVSVVIVAAAGVAFHYGILVSAVESQVNQAYPGFWATAIAFLILAAGLIGFAVGGIDQQTAELVASLDQKNREQQEMNEKLRQEIAERLRSEKLRHEMTIKLQRSEKMEFLGTLAGGVAHDLNNVLAGVTGYSEILLLKKQNREQVMKYLESIRESGKKAAAIVQDFLTLARRGVIVREAVNLNDIVFQYLNSPEHERLKQFHPTMETELRLADSLMNVIGSPVHISKTIMNLVSNAAEAMTDGGRLIISTGNLILNRPISGFEEIEPGEYVTISVEDMGMGISPEDMKKIFEPFYTKKVMGRSGTGLGMSVVWWTIKDHQGYVDIQSAEGKGTLVTIYLPATRQQTLPKDVPLPMDDYFGQGESVLVVDDIKEQRELARTIFYELGYMVETVSSGEKAIAYLEEKKTDIVFLDMIMDPGMDGLDTLKQIIATNPQQKAIVTSGFSETDRIIEAENLGAVKFLKKPYQLEQLARLVKQLLRSE